MFKHAIDQLIRENSLVGIPQPFQDYVLKQGIEAGNTARFISINKFADLQEELREEGYMVFRLGSPSGQRHTNFALAKVQQNWSDFFLLDDELFAENEPELFEPDFSQNDLLIYQLLPNLTESSLINLALSSGLISSALKLDQTPLGMPATGMGNFTFQFRPLRQDSTILTHQHGPVEMDSIFLGKRNGQVCLFVIEAKFSRKWESLGKHKLVYPVLSLASEKTKSFPIVPVYLRILKRKDHYHFCIAECETLYPEVGMASIEEFSCVSTCSYRVDSF